MIWLVGIFALIIGAVLGLFGGGGSILAVPVLVHIAGLGSKEAIAMSLLVVGATSVIGALHHARHGNVDWRAGLTFAPFAMVGAFLGGLLAQFIPGAVLLALFAVMMIVTSAAMLRGRSGCDDVPEATDVPPERAALWMIGLEGLAIGGFTGLVGAGGGFLVVPTLMLLGGLSMRRAVGTSLVVIAAKSVTGFLGYISHVSVDYTLAGTLVVLAIVGTLGGAAASKRIPAHRLRAGFAYFVLVIGVFMLMEPLGWPLYTIAVLAAAVLAFAVSLKQWNDHRTQPHQT